jgi:hypothetical protein
MLNESIFPSTARKPSTLHGVEAELKTLKQTAAEKNCPDVATKRESGMGQIHRLSYTV